MRVVYVPLDMSAGERAAWEWLVAQPDIAAIRANPSEALRMVRLARADVVWIDAATPVANVPPGIAHLAEHDVITRWLLTNGAVTLPHRFGIDTSAPNGLIDRVWRDEQDELFLFHDFTETPRLRGHMAFRRHGLFNGLGSGTYTWRPQDGECFRATTCVRPVWPADARVIAVERAFIHINEQRATIWAYESPRPILCIGAYLPFASPDPLFRRNLERLTRNALDWPARSASEDVLHDLYWPPHEPVTRERSAAMTTAVPSRPSRDVLPIDLSLLRLASRSGDPFTLAGRRAMIAGHIGGTREVWIHPLRVMQIEAESKRTIVEAFVSPLGIEERGARGQHSIAVVPEQPIVIFQWAGGPVRFTWRTDLRLMWPYPAGALGRLHWSASSRALEVSAPASLETVRFEASADVEWNVEDASSPDSSALRCTLATAAGEAFRLTVAASVLGDKPVGAILEAGDPADFVRARAAALRRRAHEQLRVDAPDTDIGPAIAWAIERLDSYLVETPGPGRSLIAGYWTSRPGWNDGRPGYAWYFGRDAVWTALACLACGDFAPARDVIAFLGNHQDLSGKILHECTTSGSVHYDAADSTPLYLLLVARHHAWSGNAAFTRSQMARIRAALDFCLGTDTDGDGLIENTRVGHGWIEFGPLGGGKVTYYTAGIWAAALRELVATFEDIGEHELARRIREHARAARTSLERLFYSAGRRRYALKAWNPGTSPEPPTIPSNTLPDTTPTVPSNTQPDTTPTVPSNTLPDTTPTVPSNTLPASEEDVPDGHAASETFSCAGLDWARDLTPTATHAVPLLLGVADPDRARSWLDRVASPDFSTGWGVRMVPRSEPHFDPASYHGGAVWPLYTGWTAWAEYAAGRSESAFKHWRDNLALAFEGERGAWPEVLHGLERRSIGVCPDQAWSTAMAVAPFVYGMLGAEPDAVRGRLRLRPQIPAAWDRLDVRNIRMGDAILSFRYLRGGATHSFTLEQDEGAVPIRILFEPAIQARSIGAVRIDGIVARLDQRPHGERILVPAQVVLDHARTIEIDAID